MKERLRGSVLMFLALMLAVAVTAAACGSSEEKSEGAESSSSGSMESTAPASPAADAGGESGGIASTLSDYAIALPSDSVPAGTTTFDITNSGPSEHEFVVIKTDLDAGDLPMADDNTVDEEQLNGIGEAEDIAAGASTTLELNLKPGHYAIICNIAGHYQLGMYTNLEVK